MVMDSCMVAYDHTEQRPLFLKLLDKISPTLASLHLPMLIAMFRVEIEQETHARNVPVVYNLLFWTKCLMRKSALNQLLEVQCRSTFRSYSSPAYCLLQGLKER
ncbi:uncharacterized protein LOC110745562 [Prunus avium]|uniref:Uncharacterized protein LOC110745562 n=1 Tax=Prunus avium TaxID=42229 RepID=A0A6P5R906_PRUAV|nr:uncharacterized protein LOC110745562 [Prunus avium]